LIVVTLLAMLLMPSAASPATAAVSGVSRDVGRHASINAAPATASVSTGAVTGTRLARTLFSTFGTISTSGAIVDRFGVGNNFDALAFVPQSVGYGRNLFYYLRHA
jgi:hypothetical protein